MSSLDFVVTSHLIRQVSLANYYRTDRFVKAAVSEDDDDRYGLIGSSDQTCSDRFEFTLNVLPMWKAASLLLAC